MSLLPYAPSSLHDARIDVSNAILEQVGAPLVEEGSWVKDAPKDAYILGLKELPEDDFLWNTSTSPLHTATSNRVVGRMFLAGGPVEVVLFWTWSSSLTMLAGEWLVSTRADNSCLIKC